MVNNVVVIAISNKCFKDHTRENTGPALCELVSKEYPATTVNRVIIPDDKDLIEREMKKYCDTNVDLILTVGGTGPAHKDVTLEATKAVIQKEVPCITIALTLESLKKSPTAMLCRSIAGIRDKTLIINLSGNEDVAKCCFELLRPILSDAISIIKNGQ